jgi:hypothetical protein
MKRRNIRSDDIAIEVAEDDMERSRKQVNIMLRRYQCAEYSDIRPSVYAPYVSSLMGVYPDGTRMRGDFTAYAPKKNDSGDRTITYHDHTEGQFALYFGKNRRPEDGAHIVVLEVGYFLIATGTVVCPDDYDEWYIDWD